MQSPPVVFVCKSPENGDAHWRCARPAARLAEAGIDARLCWLGADLMPTVPVAGRVVVLQRVIVDDGDEAAARVWVDRLRAAGAVAVVSELDDDEISGAQIVHAEATHLMSRGAVAELERQARGHIAMLRAVDGVTVSTEPLAEVVRRYTDRPVVAVPNAIDVDWFRERLVPRPEWADYLTIGWTGWRRPDADLEPMAEAWGRIARRYPDVRFVVGGHQADVIYRQDIDLDRIIRLPVAPLDEYPAMYQVDIGCCAVADTPFSRCKTPIKAWEYAVAGAAVVATPTLYGPCAEGNAVQADGADEWEISLRLLIESPLHRDGSVRLMRRHVERHHGLTTQLHRWTDAYRAIIERVRGPA